MKLKLSLFKRLLTLILLGFGLENVQAQNAVFYKIAYDGNAAPTREQWQAIANRVIGNELIKPVWTYERNSPYGKHVTFTLAIDGKPVHERMLKLHLPKGAAALTVSHNISGLLEYLAQGFYPVFPSLSNSKGNPCWLFEEGVLLPAIVHTENQTERPGQWTVYADIQGNEIKRVDENMYYGAMLNTDTPVTGRVFNPDPITTAERTYGNEGLTDRGDSNSVQLEAQLRNVSFKAKYSDGKFYLEDDDFVVVETGLGRAIPTPGQPVFNYNRSQDEFESVNAFYHLQTYLQHVRKLGYDEIPGFQTHVDAHCCRSDESLFQPSGLILRFGNGGIDDAEDADIVVHEFTHALSYGAAMGSNVGFERQAIDEGFSDYMAGSYSNAISTWQWEKVFNWDGNMTWQGRSLNASRVYPASQQAGIHRNGEIISGALMKLWFDLGRDVTDKLVLESMFYLVGNMTMPQYAELIMDADSVLFGGIHRHIIRQRMAERNLMTPSSVNGITGGRNWNFYGSADFAAGKGILMIENTTNQPFDIELFTLQGVQLLSISSENNKAEIQPADLKSGIYLIRLSTGSESYTTRIQRF